MEGSRMSMKRARYFVEGTLGSTIFIHRLEYK
jgi:hypothetical protein